ncbi:fibrinogen silencer-binding protein [Discoglossus pictus]
MVGKFRSSNFTVFEKLDLLKLVKPYIGVLEEHTNKHSVIIEKNNCWEIIAEKYNAMGAGRPSRTAQGLRTLYKRLKEYAKQELLQCKTSQADYHSSVSEATKKLVELIPQFGNVCYVMDVNGMPSEMFGSELDPSIGSLHTSSVEDHPAAVTVELEQEEDVKPPPSLIIDPLPPAVTDNNTPDFDPTVERSCSPLSSVENLSSISPSLSHSPIARREEYFAHSGEHLRSNCVCSPQALQMIKKEHEIILNNQRQYGLYIKEKREGLKRRQKFEEELLKAKIKVEKLKAIRLRHDLPEFNNL